MLLTLLFLSMVGGFCSGLIGVGGAVILIPLLLAMPPLLGTGSLSMHEIAGITMIQVLAASVTGYLAHRRSRLAHMPTIVMIGLPMGLLSFVGAAVSQSMSGHLMLGMFFILVVVAFALLLRPAVGEDSSEPTPTFTFRPVVSAICGCMVGFMSGVVGAGGGFILIPIMIRILRIPMRVTVGSSLGIVFIGALMGSVGKIITFQVQWTYLAPVLIGSLPASLCGAYVSKRISPCRIRQILLVLVLVIMIKTLYDLITY